MTARYYVYRNLNFGLNFSVKHRGRVINYIDSGLVRNASFQVSEAGRLRCLNTRKRNVHAFVSSVEEPQIASVPKALKLVEVKYNPYVKPNFFRKDTGEVVIDAPVVYFLGGKAFIL